MSLRVLLVDVNENVCDVFVMMFQHCGYSVTTAHNGTAALAIAQADPPDAIFSSLRIGDMDGFELCRKVRQLPETRHCVMVAVTGGGADAYETKARAAGFDYFFIKPVSLEDMISALKPLEHRRALH